MRIVNEFWSNLQIKFRVLSFVVVSFGSVYLLFWAVDCLPLSILGKLIVAGIVSLIFLFAGIWLFVVDWKRKIIEDFSSNQPKTDRRRTKVLLS